jgi:serine protease Do
MEKQPQTFPLAQSIATIQHSVVQITSTSGHILGTGFLVNSQGHIITNYHILKPILDSPNPVPMIGFAHQATSPEEVSISPSFIITDAVVIETDIIHDLALLKIHQIPEPQDLSEDPGLPASLWQAVKLNDHTPEEGTGVAVSGFPLPQLELITNSGPIATVSSGNTAHPDGSSAAYYADMQVDPGNSGGPVYLAETGEVIGVAVAYDDTLADTLLESKKPGEQYTREEEDRINAWLAVWQEFRLSNQKNAGLSVIIPIKNVIQLLTETSTSLD